MHGGQHLIVAIEGIGRLIALALDSANPVYVFIAAVLVPVGAYVLAQIGAAIIGLYAQRYWIAAFEERERQVVDANRMLRATVRKLLRANSLLTSRNAMLVQQARDANARAEHAESLLTHLQQTDDLDFVI
ncbi:MAG TPA: hypothetical protein VEX16_03710 [Methyloceanibacter sp.]|nr:hypothetical protein [Methyloceanibacter sp.]